MTWRVLHGEPLIGRECLDHPLAVESADSGILFATKRAVRQIDDRLVVDMHHANLEALGKPLAALEIAGKYTAGKPMFRVIGNPERVVFPAGANDRRDGAEDLIPRQRHVVGYIGEHMRRQD